ncbi:unnamed protein product, partial [Prorocentrum cordatum]
MNNLQREGLGIEGHRKHFRQICKLGATDWGVQEHYQLCQQIKAATCQDFLDGTSLICTGMKFRRLQTIEFATGTRPRTPRAKVIEHVHDDVEKEAKLHKSLRLQSPLGSCDPAPLAMPDVSSAPVPLAGVRGGGAGKPRSNSSFCGVLHPSEMFTEALGVRLATGDAIGTLEMTDSDDLLTVEGAGLKDASTKLHPRLRVAPMGWSWATWWCQSVMERAAEAAGCDDVSLLCDGRPLPTLALACHLKYVDNFVDIGYDAGAVRGAVARVMAELQRRGLVVNHEGHVGDSEGEYSILGWSLTSTGRLSASASRLWRARLAVRGLLRCGRASGRDLERVLGRILFVTLARREGLRILESCFRFVQRCYRQEVPLWSQVRQELVAWDGVAPLLWRDLQAQWSPSVGCVDASSWGLGACVADWRVGAVREVGRYSERWRYGRAERLPRRRRARAAELFADGAAACGLGFGADLRDPARQSGGRHAVGSPVERDLLAFPEVPNNCLEHVQWTITGRRFEVSIAHRTIRNSEEGEHDHAHGRYPMGPDKHRIEGGLESPYRGPSESWLSTLVSWGSALHLAVGLIAAQMFSMPVHMLLMALFLIAGATQMDMASALLCGYPRKRPAAALSAQASSPALGRSARGPSSPAAGSPVPPAPSVSRPGSSVQPVPQACTGMLTGPDSWAGQHRRIVADPMRMDCTMRDYINVLFEKGFHQTYANRVIAATARRDPRFAKTGPCDLLFAAQLPYEEVLAMIVNYLSHQRCALEACAIWLLFEINGRPGEIHGLRLQDIVPPTPSASGAHRFLSVTLRAQEVGEVSKTGEFDAPVRLALERQAGLGQGLLAMAAARGSGGAPPWSPLFAVSQPQVANAWRKAARAPGLAKLGACHACQLRHSGPGHDYAAGLRDLEQIRRRGRWKSWSSVRRRDA